MKEITNKKYFFIVFLIIFLFVGSTSYFLSQSLICSDFNAMINNDYVYSYNNEFVNDYYKDDNNACYYAYGYIDNGASENEEILYLNENAFKYGIPYFDKQVNFVYFFKTNNVQLELDKILTNKKNLANNDITYVNYIKDHNIKSVYINFKTNFDYICVSNSYFETNDALFSIYDHVDLAMSYDSNVKFNQGLENNQYVLDGKAFKENKGFAYKMFSEILLCAFIIPLIILFLTLNLFYGYYLDSKKNEIIISNIYYKKKKDIIKNRYWELIKINVASLFVSSLIMTLLFMRNHLLFAILLFVLFALVFSIDIRLFVKKKINLYIKDNNWRNV